MQILNLKLLNFRNYEKLELEFDPSMNIIIGKNGMGMTNIIEAIYVLAFTKSFRGSKEEVIIRNNADLTRIEGTVKDKYKNDYKIIIKKLYIIARNKKKGGRYKIFHPIKINIIPTNRRQKYFQVLQLVLKFYHILLVKYQNYRLNHPSKHPCHKGFRF